MITALEVIGGLMVLGGAVFLVGCVVVAAFNAAITEAIGRGLNL